MKRKLGRSNIEVSAVGMGCWAISGMFRYIGNPAGWGTIDDNESIRAIHKAVDLGATFFDTAANYGCGHSERILGQAVKDCRDQVVLATKFGHKVDAANKEVNFYGESEEESDVVSHMRVDLETSLKNLDTDYIDLYQLHVWGLSIERALMVRDQLETFIKGGKIRAYGWSTDRPDAIKAFSTLPGCSTVQQGLNIFDGNMELLALCEEMNLASINRSPLGMGILTGKFTSESTFSPDDVRRYADWFPGFDEGRPTQKWLDALESIREILTSKGRTLAQGALAWIWGRSPNTIPIPGFKTVAQVEENCRAMEFGPLTSDQMKEIDSILKR
ncbi:MAG: aldo/keto reductase [Desulfobacteraceae bacterium]|jgi:aryl-alcohol dehydrogenase-like predicted oxidoreductase